jgi:DNA-binding MarR family transcriptional regulator
MMRMTDHTYPAIMSLFGAYAALEERFSGELGAVHGLGLKESLMLLHLAGATAGRLTRVDMAKRLSTTASTITRIAQPLEKLGLLDREADPRDARLAYIVLTQTGREAAGNIRLTLQRQCSTAFRGDWTAVDIERFAHLAGRLAAGRNAQLV